MSKPGTYKLTDADALYEQLKSASLLPNAGVTSDLRKEGLNRYKALGLPTQKQEEWRFTNLAPMTKEHFAASTDKAADAGKVVESADEYGLMKLSAVTFVFVNGFFRQDLSQISDLPDNVTAKTLASNLADETVQKFLGKIAVDVEHPFVALNNALFSDGLLIHIPAKTVVSTPIHVVFLTTGNDAPLITNPRLLVVAEESSEATILESYLGPDEVPYLTNSVAEFDLEENAVVDHYRLNVEGRSAFHLTTLDARQSRDSNLSTQAITFGGRLNRNDIGMLLDGEGAFGNMNGLFQITDNQFVDNHTRIDHAKPNCETHELYKAILDGKSRGVFNGRIMVRQIAQKTDSKQTNRTLLLSQDALINTNPQLEIFADDVKCTHGATVGQIDENQLYYLKSRGISDDEARRMLVFAFANDVVERIKPTQLRELLEHRLLEAQKKHNLGEALAEVR